VLATLPADSVHTVVTSPPYYALRSYLDASHPDKHREIGSEPTPDEYLATMVAVFREVKRVLRPDGTVWCNIGDSFSGGNNVGWRAGNPDKNGGNSNRDGVGAVPGLAAKQLLMMPARLALALQADGWWLRSDIIWHKPNPMPESCRDRPTSAHEHVFLLTKSARYFYDADAVREEPTGRTDMSRVFNTSLNGDREMREYPKDGLVGRNLRNVWTLPTAPYSEAHFATFPPALAERCIKAGTSERGCCSQCGKPWTRITERSVAFTSGSGKAGNVPNGKHAGAVQALSGDYDIRMGPSVASTTTGWRAGCGHDAPVSPCVVLDPFAGAGTTLLVADRLQRDAIGIELNTAYTEMAMQRCRDDAPLFVDVPAADPEDERMADLFAEAAE
jgi:DNA modification methylase